MHEFYTHNQSDNSPLEMAKWLFRANFIIFFFLLEYCQRCSSTLIRTKCGGQGRYSDSSTKCYIILYSIHARCTRALTQTHTCIIFYTQSNEKGLNAVVHESIIIIIIELLKSAIEYFFFFFFFQIQFLYDIFHTESSFG